MSNFVEPMEDYAIIIVHDRNGKTYPYQGFSTISNGKRVMNWYVAGSELDYGWGYIAEHALQVWIVTGFDHSNGPHMEGI